MYSCSGLHGVGHHTAPGLLCKDCECENECIWEGVIERNIGMLLFQSVKSLYLIRMAHRMGYIFFLLHKTLFCGRSTSSVGKACNQKASRVIERPSCTDKFLIRDKYGTCMIHNCTLAGGVCVGHVLCNHQEIDSLDAFRCVSRGTAATCLSSQAWSRLVVLYSYWVELLLCQVLCVEAVNLLMYWHDGSVPKSNKLPARMTRVNTNDMYVPK